MPGTRPGMTRDGIGITYQRRSRGTMEQLQSALGVVALIAFAWIISENRRAVPWRSVAAGLAVTVALAALLLKVPQVKGAFAVVNDAIDSIAAATRAGT